MVAYRLPVDAVDPVLYGILQGLPEGVKGEILNGELRVVPHAFLPHSGVTSRLHAALAAAFELGATGPGGWAFLENPQLNLGADVIQPDLVAWKSERAPLEHLGTYAQVLPDWVAEVLSDKTWKQDRGPRMEAWGRRGLPHVWILDPEEETLEVFWSDAGTMRPLQSFQGRVKVRAAPFDSVDLDLGFVWPRKTKP